MYLLDQALGVFTINVQPNLESEHFMYNGMIIGLRLTLLMTQTFALIQDHLLGRQL